MVVKLTTNSDTYSQYNNQIFKVTQKVDGKHGGRPIKYLIDLDGAGFSRWFFAGEVEELGFKRLFGNIVSLIKYYVKFGN